MYLEIYFKWSWYSRFATLQVILLEEIIFIIDITYIMCVIYVNVCTDFSNYGAYFVVSPRARFFKQRSWLYVEYIWSVKQRNNFQASRDLSRCIYEVLGGTRGCGSHVVQFVGGLIWAIWFGSSLKNWCAKIAMAYAFFRLQPTQFRYVQYLIPYHPPVFKT